MRCPSCGTENPEVARFCMACGASLVGVCAARGDANPPEGRLCMQFDRRVRGAGATPARG